MWAGVDGSRRATTQAGRATMGLGHAQTGRVARQRKQVARRRVLVARRRVPKVRKLWKAISHSKLVQIEHLRCFLASTGNLDAINTSNARFGQVLSEIWPAEVFWSQNSCGRAQAGPKSQRTLDGHISLKTCPNQAFEGFFGIYRKCRCQKTPQTPDSDTF